jgi:hypothetical protein
MSIARRRTLDGFVVDLDSQGRLAHGGGNFTRHPGLSIPDALVVAEAVGLFERQEMPSLASAAATLAKKGPLSLWPVVKLTTKLSHRAGTAPADMPVPRREVDVAVWAPHEIRARQAGFVVAPKGTRRISVPIEVRGKRRT